MVAGFWQTKKPQAKNGKLNQAQVTFPCGDILLEGIWHFPAAAILPPVVIVCHPHPLYGGNMTNNVVLAICQALAEQSIAAFRFNFRGAGNSGGEYGGGVGEQADVKSALAVISSNPDTDSKRIGLAGYSFGAGVALPVALQDERVKRLALVSPALSVAGWEQLKKYPGPKLLIAGDADSVISREQLGQYAADFAGPPDCQMVPGADHFWQGYEEEAGRRVARFFATGFG